VLEIQLVRQIVRCLLIHSAVEVTFGAYERNGCHLAPWIGIDVSQPLLQVLEALLAVQSVAKNDVGETLLYS